MPHNIDAAADTLSIIVVNRNTSRLLSDCLRHIFESEVMKTLQVIVVDNGSTDDSVSMVREKFPDVLLIEAGRNLGFAKANNLGFDSSTGKSILLVNSDAMLRKDCASRLIRTMESNPSIGMVGPQLLNKDTTPQTSYEATPTLLTELVGRGILKVLFPRRYPGRNLRPSGPIEVETLIGAVILISREAWENMRGFDEAYFFFFEETDLAYRMRKSGLLVYHDPDARAVHLQGATAKKYNAAPRIEYYRSRYIFFRKRYGKPGEIILKTALTINLTLNTIVLGLGTILTLGRSREIKEKFFQRLSLWIWHIKGFPKESGLPRD